MARMIFWSVVAICAHAAIWFAASGRTDAPPLKLPLPSVSYTPFDGSADPERQTEVSPHRIRADLAAVAPLARGIRTYSSTGGMEQTPAIAAEFGLAVSVGAWIGRDPERNEREIRAALDAAKASSVTGILVGNETIYRGDQTPTEIIAKIRQVKARTSLPVTTGEIWSAWLDNPELVAAVDYIAAHVLPYWEGVPHEQAVEQALRAHRMLSEAYPGKKVVLAEFGWPSAGHNRGAAQPGSKEQAWVLRNFVDAANRNGVDFNLIEAYDQPWKTFEGGVGPYWGVLDTSRQPKFAWKGDIARSGFDRLALMAILAGALLTWPVLRMAPGLRSGVPPTTMQALLLIGAAHLGGAWCAYVLDFWLGRYFVAGAAFSFWLGAILLAPLLLILWHRVEEIAALTLGPAPARLVDADVRARNYCPMVSIHIPMCNEPPAMVIETLEAVARLDYPRFECIVLVNNTRDPALVSPIEACCRRLGPRFRFHDEPELAGFKAGALRVAAQATSPEAEIIGLLDADYVVRPDWLAALVPAFADPSVGLVQAPQDHRHDGRNGLARALADEYSGFFDIGMVHRNEVNAIVVHGTMCLVRRAALESAGGWSSDTICEDADLGVAVLKAGWRARYTDRRFGFGLLPDTLADYRRQRFRWALGGLQIAIKHRAAMLAGGGLDAWQRRAFNLGWLTWLGAESAGALLALLNLASVPFVLAGILVPETILTAPILALFVLTIVHFAVLYRVRLGLGAPRTLAALVCAMSLQWTIAKAVAQGCIGRRSPFRITAKGGAGSAAQHLLRTEGLIGSLLIGAAMVVAGRNAWRVREIDLFALVLAVQSAPFLAAAGLALAERYRPLSAPVCSGDDLRIAPQAAKAEIFVEVAADEPAAVGQGCQTV